MIHIFDSFNLDFDFLFHLGENPLNFTEAFLHRIQETSDPNDPFYSNTGELNLTNTLTDLFIAGSDTTAVTLGLFL